MGRGLSDLQKRILVLANENSRTRKPGYAHLYAYEIMRDIFGFSYAFDYEKELTPSAYHFYPRGMTPDEMARYDRVHATVSRSIKRLVWRELAVTQPKYLDQAAGVNLTDSGRTTADSLSQLLLPISLTDKYRSSPSAKYEAAARLHVSTKSATRAAYVVTVIDLLGSDDPLSQELLVLLNKNIAKAYRIARQLTA